MADAPHSPLTDLPLIGWMTQNKRAALILVLVALAVVALISAVVSFGPVALGLTALTCVPVMFCILIAITQGK